MSTNTQRRRSRRDPRGQFACGHCKRAVSDEAYGTHHRNHCPHCLWSRHVDEQIGDRQSPCGGLMEPIGVWVRGDGEWAIVHRCVTCGLIRTNRIAGDDAEWPLLALGARPLAHPPFPLA